MTRWFKNIAIIASLLTVGCVSPTVPTSAKIDANLDVIQTSTHVEVTSALGEVLEVLDAPNLTLTEQRSRRAAVKVRSLTQGGHGSGTYMVAYGRRIVATAAHVVRNETVMAIDGCDGETVVGSDADLELPHAGGQDDVVAPKRGTLQPRLHGSGGVPPSPRGGTTGEQK